MATGRIGVTPNLRTRWSKAPAGGTTSLSGLDDNSVSLVYDAGFEAVYRNGVLLSRGNDYTATNGTTITLIDATIAGDIIEVFANQAIPLTSTYTQAVADAKFINNSLVDAKGDIIAATAADTVARLAVGSNDQVLTADSTTSTGLKWATPSAGGMTLISTTTLTGASVSLTSIPQTYVHLQLIIQNFKPATDDRFLAARINGDSTASRHYSMRLDGDVSGEVSKAFDSISFRISGNNDNSVATGLSVIDLWNYTNTGTWKFANIQSISVNPTTTTNFNPTNYFGVYNQTGAISSIDLFPSGGNFTSGTVLLYGVK